MNAFWFTTASQQQIVERPYFLQLGRCNKIHRKIRGDRRRLKEPTIQRLLWSGGREVFWLVCFLFRNLADSENEMAGKAPNFYIIGDTSSFMLVFPVSCWFSGGVFSNVVLYCFFGGCEQTGWGESLHSFIWYTFGTTSLYFLMTWSFVSRQHRV